MRRVASLSAAAMGLAAAIACGVWSADPAGAQTIGTPAVGGDQLIFFYDARTDRVPFLGIANPSNDTVLLEIAFYDQTLQTRLGSEIVALASAANLVINPTQFADGAANGSAGIAVVTPVASADDPQAVVPPTPLVGGFTLANLALGSGFGQNPFARSAVTSSGGAAAPGTTVDGQQVAYERFTPTTLMVPVYFNPNDLGPPEQDGNRVVLATFVDDYSVPFSIGGRTSQTAVQLLDADGTGVGSGSVTVNGVLLTDLQSLATGLDGSGKVYFNVDAGDGSYFGIFSQSLQTFASGQRMPSVPIGDPIMPPTPTPAPTPGTGDGCTVTVSVGYATSNVTGIQVALTYPASAGLPDPPDDRVSFLVDSGGGLERAIDNPPTLNLGVVATSPIDDGPFASIDFNGSCTVAGLSCSVLASTDIGAQVPAECSISVN